MAAILIGAGLLALVVGAEMLVRGASRLALALGVAPLIVGLTVVAFGTSAPELAVSVRSAVDGTGEIALGNVVGSNIFNVLLILGLSAIVAPLVVSRQLVRIDVPILIVVSAIAWAMAADGRIGRVEGLLLAAAFVAYSVFLAWYARRGSSPKTPTAASERPGRRGIAFALLAIAAGLPLLVLGARWLVDGAVDLARQFGVGELVIGLTIVAAGTSLPELATSAVAGLRGQRDIAVGNVIGSNLFNLLVVLGAAAIVAPDGLAVPASVLRLDLPVMVVAAIACIPIFVTGGRISRGEGAMLAAYYIVYICYLVLAARSAASAGWMRDAVVFGAAPVTAVALACSLAPRRRRAKSADPTPPSPC